jgi:hypothetical protein
VYLLFYTNISLLNTSIVHTRRASHVSRPCNHTFVSFDILFVYPLLLVFLRLFPPRSSLHKHNYNRQRDSTQKQSFERALIRANSSNLLLAFQLAHQRGATQELADKVAVVRETCIRKAILQRPVQNTSEKPATNRRAKATGESTECCQERDDNGVHVGMGQMQEMDQRIVERRAGDEAIDEDYDDVASPWTCRCRYEGDDSHGDGEQAH